MTQAAPAPRRMSKSALLSLIFGILFCIPFLTGVLAMLLGLIGFVKTGKPGVSGRWMAIVGGLLGTFGVVTWTLFFGSITAMIFAVLGMTQPVRAATHDFIRDLSTAPYAQLHADNPGYEEADLKELQAYVKDQGAFVDTTFPSSSIENDTGHVEGIAQFSKGTQQVSADLEQVGGKWRVTHIIIKP